MTVLPTSGTGSSTTGTGTTQTGNSAGNVDYQSFLKLLVAEMKNQDPSNPMDSTQYVAQLASFSQVEQTIQVNNKLADLLQGSAVAQAGSLLGHTLTSADGSVSGVVSTVKLTSDGLVAVLEGGTEVTVETGITVQ
jgi:flagellar basal-body rod modification protein FlgD